MNLRLKKALILSLAIVPLSILAIILAPRFVAADAGPGGGGGSSGCSQYNYSTCFGAVWRYYQTTSNSYPIRNVGSGYTYVNGCGATGGFFAYVLVHKNFPNDPNQVRSWQIGPVDNEWGNRSMFFGGWTNYRKYSHPNDPIPTNPSPGDYSWYQAEKAFAQTKSLGQNSGYEWNASSMLGWFCYRGLDYTLNPTINASPDSSEGGSQVTLSPNVQNSGATTSGNAQWQVTTFRINPGGNVPGGPATNGTAPVNHYGNNASVVASGTRTFNRGNNGIAVAQQTLGDFPVGTRICYALSVQPYRHDNGAWRHSAPDCVIISKKPKVQILGSDLFVGKDRTSRIVTSSTTKNIGGTNRTFGSWGEYGVTASSTIAGMASGSGYSGGGTSSLFCDVSLLTFTSAGTGSCTPSTTKGNYVMNKALPDISARLAPRQALGANPTLNVSTAATNIYSATGNVSLTSSGDISPGRWVIINAPTATVTIRDNIRYTSAALGSIADIPQVVIIANEIRIEGDVTQVDAWLIATGATGNIVTCSDVATATQLTANVCNQPLTVNGPVVARHLFLYRTAGAGVGAQTGAPAEVFNLRPDAYLWATAFSADAGRLQTVSTKELPPRF